MKINICDARVRRVCGARRLACLAGFVFLAAAAAWAGIDITGAPARVVWDVGSCAVAGTNTSDIVGDMWVSNATAGGAALSFNGSGDAFIAPAIALQVGKNYLAVYGTNAAGDGSSATVNIWRYNPDGSGQQAGSHYGRRWRGPLTGWGYDYYGQASCPGGNDFVAVAAGYYHALALRSDGTLTGWGRNDYGQTNCPGGNGFVAVAAGQYFSLALRNDGTLAGWGRNDYGQTNCPGGNDFVAVAAGQYFSLALRSDGTLTGWGRNDYGQTNYPVGNDFVAVAGGRSYALALHRDGALTGWGRNDYGQTNCPGGNDFVAVAAGQSHALGLRSDGTLVGWGDNSAGQTNCPGGSNYVAVAAGELHALALQGDGTLTGWGANGDGQTNCPSGNDFVTIAAGFSYSLALKFSPFMDITNGTTLVTYATTQSTLGGTNSPWMDALNGIVGTIWWSNALNSAHGACAAAQSWTIANIAVGFGTNVIAVYGTNVYGWLGYASVNIIRAFPAGTQIVLGAPLDGYLTNQSPVSFNVTYGDTIAYRYLATNSVPVFNDVQTFLFTNKVTFSDTGTIYWTGLGYDSSYNIYWAFETNRLTIQKTLTPGVHLVAPVSGIALTNVFACMLDVDYGAVTEDRQLSINAGASWFAFAAENPVVFNSVGTYRWTARGRTAAGWWRAPETNTLVLTTNYSGDRAIFLAEPADGLVTTNGALDFRVLTYGAAFAFTQVSIDQGAFATVTFPTNTTLAVGQHQWTARGGGLPGPVYTDAPTTNVFWVMPEEYSMSVVCITSGMHHVGYADVTTVLAGTNTSELVGGMWVANASAGGAPIGFSRSGLAFTTPPVPLNVGTNVLEVHGTNVYGVPAGASVMVTREGIAPLVDITNTPVTVTYDVTSYAVAGTNNPNCVGGMWVSNATAGGAAVSFSHSGLAFATPAVALQVGANAIGVYGTNILGVVAGDSVTITRNIPGTGGPFIDATSTPVFVIYNTARYDVAGTNNANVMGSMSWTNTNTGGAGTLAAAASWRIPAIAMAVGANEIVVRGTNLLGAPASDSVTITRGDPSTATPYIDVTNADRMVIYDVASTSIGGSNNIGVVALWWSNSLTSAGGTLAPGNPWWATNGIAFAVGTNVISVYGTNALNVFTSDSVAIVRGDPSTATPYVDVTNANQTVIYDIVSATIGGSNNIGVVALWWSNSLTSAGGTLAPGSPWWAISDIALNVGANIITVYSTNALNVTARDSVTITRSGTSTATPYIEVTNANQAVIYNSASTSIGISNNVGVVRLWWSNSLTSAGGTLLSGNPWRTINGIALDVGANVITVYGTNALNVPASGSVTITRGDPSTATPYVDVTNADRTVIYDSASTSIGGSNNLGVVALWWSNSLTSAGATLAPGSPWWATNGIALAVGTNVISVCGTNALNVFTSDNVTILRGDPATATPFVDVTNVNQTVIYDIVSATIGGSNNLGVVALWWSNSLTSAGGTLAPGSPWWAISDIALNVGANIITVYSTNGLNVTARDSVTITRSGTSTATPYIKVTNANQTVSYDSASTSIGISNNVGVVRLWWSNSLTSAGGTVLPGNPWRTINGIALGVGANVIAVYGTNALNVPASDSVVVFRLPGAPANVRATDGTFTNKVHVTFTASSGATNYMVYRAPGSNPTNFAEISSAITATTYDDTTVAAGQQYYYAVQAASLYGWSALGASDSGFALLAINAGAWKYKGGAKLNRKGKMTGKDVMTGKQVNPALQPLFEQGCRIGLAELMAGVVTNWNGPYTVIPNKNKKLWQVKDPAKGQPKVACIMYTVNSKKGDTLTYQLWTNMPPLGTQMIYILPTNLLFNAGTLLNEQGNSTPPVQFRLRPTGTVDKQGWQPLDATVIEAE